MIALLPEVCVVWSLVTIPFQTLPRSKEVATNFVCRLYSNKSNDHNDVDLVRMRLFSQKTRDVERISPSIDALDQHLKRSVFQASSMGNHPHVHDAYQQSQLTMDGRKSIAIYFTFDHGAPCQGCVPLECEVHLPNYLFSVQMREDKVKLHMSAIC